MSRWLRHVVRRLHYALCPEHWWMRGPLPWKTSLGVAAFGWRCVRCGKYARHGLDVRPPRAIVK